LQNLEQLKAVDRAPAELEVDRDVIGDRGRCGETTDVVRSGIDGAASVVIEPSTRATSYGPGSTRLVASKKYAISILPASVSNSSSSDNSDNWQPSHEANLKTAMRGFAVGDAATYKPSTLRYGSISSNR
jgi:hypothetical protein